MPAAKKQHLLRTIVEAITTAADLNMRSVVAALGLALVAAERAPLPPPSDGKC